MLTRLSFIYKLQVSEEEQGESDSVAKYVSWSEPNRTPMENSEETSWASLSIQHPKEVILEEWKKIDLASI